MTRSASWAAATSQYVEIANEIEVFCYIATVKKSIKKSIILATNNNDNNKVYLYRTYRTQCYSVLPENEE